MIVLKCPGGIDPDNESARVWIYAHVAAVFQIDDVVDSDKHLYFVVFRPQGELVKKPLPNMTLYLAPDLTPDEIDHAVYDEGFKHFRRVLEYGHVG